jgi:hypothetical protein
MLIGRSIASDLNVKSREIYRISGKKSASAWKISIIPAPRPRLKRVITISARLLFSPFAGFCLFAVVVPSCGSPDMKKRNPSGFNILIEEQQPAQTFLGTCRDLRTTSAYRQNIWLAWNQGEDSSQIALCVDLKNEVYLVICSSSAARSDAKLSDYYTSLITPISLLRARMDPEAFVLDTRNSPVIAIFRVPEDAPEAFGADVINAVLGTQVTPESLTFLAD